MTRFLAVGVLPGVEQESDNQGINCVFQAEGGIRDVAVTGVQTCALPILMRDAEGVRLAAGLIDDVDKFFTAVESKSNFRKGREFRVRDVDFVPDTITGRLTVLQARVAEAVKRADDEVLKAELQEFWRRIRDARDGNAIFLEQSAPEHVYWVERTGKTERGLALTAARVDLAPDLR